MFTIEIRICVANSTTCCVKVMLFLKTTKENEGWKCASFKIHTKLIIINGRSVVMKELT